MMAAAQLGPSSALLHQLAKAAVSDRAPRVSFLPGPILGDPARLDALRATELLDSSQEEAFDRFSRLASKALGVRIARVALVDDHRVFWKSAVGVAEPWATRREVPVAGTICEQVVASGAPVIVADARTHPLFGHGLAGPDAGVRALAGVPLTNSEGHTLGALCVADDRPRVWSQDEIETLIELASVIVNKIERRQQQRRLAESERRYRAVFDNAAVGILTCDGSGKILNVNERFASMLGYRGSDLGGKWLASLEHPDDSDGRLGARQQLLTGQRQQCTAEMRYRTRSGGWLRARVTDSVAHDDQGRVAFTVGLVEDLEEIRSTKDALRQSEERYRTLVRRLPNVSVLLFDHELRIMVADGDDLLRALGMSREELEGRTVEEIALPANLEAVRRAYRAALAGDDTSVEAWRNGRHLAIHTAPMRGDDGSIVGGIAMTYDITTLKETERTLREQTALISLLEDVATAANRASSTAEAYRAILQRVCTFMQWPVGHVYVGEGAELVPSDIWYLDDALALAPFCEATRACRFGPGAGLPGLTLVRGEATFLEDVKASANVPRAAAAAEARLVSGFAFPVSLGTEVVAVLEFYVRDRSVLDARSLAVMTSAGEQLGRVVERERHEATVAALSMRDELTGLLNRRGLLEQGASEHDRAIRTGSSLVAIFCDLNGMKAINDQLGHEAGDLALRDISDVLRLTLSPDDLVSRLGGDEFVVLATNADAERAAAIQAQVRSAVAEFNARTLRPYLLSISLGSAVLDLGSPAPLEDLLALADERMYEQKRQRRSSGTMTIPVPPGASTQRALALVSSSRRA